MQKDKPVIFSIIILTYNALKYTKMCLKSVEENTELPFELIVIDNNSSDGTQSFLSDFFSKDKEYPHTLILNEENAGVAGGRNQGIEVARGAYCVFLDNDTEVGKGWDRTIFRRFERDAFIGVVGKHGNKVLCYNPLFFTKMSKFEKVSEVDVVAGFCFAFPKKIIKELGDQYMGLGKFWHEDLEFCGRIKKYGYKVIEDRNIDVVHYEHKSAGDDCVTDEDIKKKFKGFNRKAKKVGRRLLDENIITIYRGFRNPYAAYEIIAKHLTEALRDEGFIVFRRNELPTTGFLNSRSFELCNTFNMVHNGKRYVHLHMENDRFPRKWHDDLELVDRVFTCNPDLYEAMKKEGIPEEKLINLSLTGFDNEVYRLEGDRLKKAERNELPINPQYFTFFNVGASQPRKGTDILIEAFCQEFTEEEPVQLLIKNYDYGKDDWVRMNIAKNGSHKNVYTVYGTWSADKLARAYRTFGDNGAYISTHRGEGFGMTQLEAVSCGMPIGYTDFGGPKYNLADLEAGRFDYELKPSTFHNHAGEPFYQADENPLWAESNIKTIRKWMRETFENGTSDKIRTSNSEKVQRLSFKENLKEVLKEFK